MSCSEYSEMLVEAARGGEVPAHARMCPECGMFLRRQLRLTAAMEELRAVAHSAAVLACPASPSRFRFGWRYAVAAGAMAASVACVWLFYPQQPVASVPVTVPPVASPKRSVVALDSPLPVKPRRRKAPAARVDLPAKAEGEFVEIPYTFPLGPGERAEVWRMQMPLADLIAVGAPISAPDPSRMAQADILVGEDGRARAFRLISVSDSSSGRSTYK